MKTHDIVACQLDELCLCFLNRNVACSLMKNEERYVIDTVGQYLLLHLWLNTEVGSLHDGSSCCRVIMSGQNPADLEPLCSHAGN